MQSKLRYCESTIVWDMCLDQILYSWKGNRHPISRPIYAHGPRGIFVANEVFDSTNHIKRGTSHSSHRGVRATEEGMMLHFGTSACTDYIGGSGSHQGSAAGLGLGQPTTSGRYPTSEGLVGRNEEARPGPWPQPQPQRRTAPLKRTGSEWW